MALRPCWPHVQIDAEVDYLLRHTRIDTTHWGFTEVVDREVVTRTYQATGRYRVTIGGLTSPWLRGRAWAITSQLIKAYGQLVVKCGA